MQKFMLDTDIAIYTIKNRPPKVREAFKSHEGQMCISSVTLMELIFGAAASSAAERNLRDVEAFASRLEVLPYDSEAGSHTGQLRAELKKAGRPIGPYDQMIAGHARARGLTIVTCNLRQFHAAPGIRPVNWAN